MGRTGGRGTVATRADIIEKLFSSFLAEKRGKDIFLTSKGRQLLGLVPGDLKKPELTAQWEMKLARIARGELSRDAFMREIRVYAADLTGQIKVGEGSFRHDNLTNTKCPAWRQADAFGEGEKQPDAGLPGPVLRAQGDYFQDHQCPVPGVP